MIAHARTRLLERRRRLRNLALASLLGVGVWWVGLVLAAPETPALSRPPMPETPPPPEPPARPDLPDLTALPLPMRAQSALAVPSLALPALPAVSVPAVSAASATTIDDDARSARLLVHPDLRRHYPPSARRRGVEGRTRVVLDIDAGGAVRTVRVAESNPPGVFEVAAQRAAANLRFAPAERDGRPVAGTLTLLFDWRLE